MRVRHDAAGVETALEQLMLIVQPAGEEQLTQRLGIVRPQLGRAAVGFDRVVVFALQLERMAELQMVHEALQRALKPSDLLALWRSAARRSRVRRAARPDSLR